MWGCGLDGPPLNTVRIRARGDLPAAEADSVLLDGGRASLDDLPEGVDAVTVEGLFGENVDAVGRTPRLPQEGTQPVYFSAPDQLCPVESPLGPRDRASVAVTPSGVVMAVGGEGLEAELLDEIVLLRDDDDEVVLSEETIPIPSVGHTLTAIGDRDFVLVGGAGEDVIPSGDATRITVDPQTLDVKSVVSQRVSLDGVGATERAFPGAVALPGGRVLVQGGCAHIERAMCVPSEASVLRSGFYVRAEDDGLAFEIAPAMLHPRYDHSLLVSSDGVVFAVGGRDDEDQGLRDIEMLLPGSPGWAPYGPALFEALGDRDIVGATLLEGGLVILVVDDGTVWRVDQNHVQQHAGWCVSADDPCFLPPPAPLDPASPTTFRRSLIGLWGERVVVDGFVLHAGILGRTGADAVDLSAVRPGRMYRPPGQRFGASSVVAMESPRVTLVYPMGRSGVPRECMTSHARQWASHACGLSRGTTCSL